MPLTGTFDSSFVALLAEMWAELEAMLVTADEDEQDAASGARRRGELRAQALMLELVLLADRCDSARWQALCGVAQVERVRAVVNQVCALLDFGPLEQDSPHARRAIVLAQNFLFDEVCRATQAQRRWPLHRTATAGSEATLHPA